MKYLVRYSAASLFLLKEPQFHQKFEFTDALYDSLYYLLLLARPPPGFPRLRPFLRAQLHWIFDPIGVMLKF